MLQLCNGKVRKMLWQGQSGEENHRPMLDTLPLLGLPFRGRRRSLRRSTSPALRIEHRFFVLAISQPSLEALGSPLPHKALEGVSQGNGMQYPFRL